MKSFASFSASPGLSLFFSSAAISTKVLNFTALSMSIIFFDVKSVDAISLKI